MPGADTIYYGTYDILDINERSKYGIVTPEELEYIIEKIKNIRPFSYDSDDLHLYIQSLALAGGKKYKNLIESFLYYLFDEEAAAMAIRSLCSYWRLTQEYIEEIDYFIRGVDWGNKYYFQIVCIDIAKEFLQKKFNKRLLETLLHIFEFYQEDIPFNATSGAIRIAKSTEHEIRQLAYNAIIDCMGKHYSAMPLSEEKIQLILENNQLHLLDMEVIKKAKDLIKNTPIEFYDITSYETSKDENTYRGDYLDTIFCPYVCDRDYLDQDQFNYLVERIKKNRSRSDDQDIPTFIRALKDADPEIHTLDDYKPLLESYLYFPQDPYFSALALNTLCEWGFTKCYLKEIKEFLKGVSWDVQHHAHFVAIEKAFRYLKETFDMELVELLLHNYTSFGDFESPLNTVDDILERDRVINIRFKAYYALKESIGITQEEDDILCQYISNENPKIEGFSPLMQALRKIQENRYI